jgi:hypothetical protein
LSVTDPIKNLLPDVTASALTLNSAFDELPSDSDSNLTALPVENPCACTTILLSTKLTVLLVSVWAFDLLMQILNIIQMYLRQSF